MNNTEMIKLFRQSSYASFTKWLTDQENKCAFCEDKCSNPWCPTEDGDKEKNEKENKSE